MIENKKEGSELEEQWYEEFLDESEGVELEGLEEGLDWEVSKGVDEKSKDSKNSQRSSQRNKQGKSRKIENEFDGDELSEKFDRKKRRGRSGDKKKSFLKLTLREMSSRKVIVGIIGMLLFLIIGVVVLAFMISGGHEKRFRRVQFQTLNTIQTGYRDKTRMAWNVRGKVVGANKNGGEGNKLVVVKGNKISSNTLNSYSNNFTRGSSAKKNRVKGQRGIEPSVGSSVEHSNLNKGSMDRKTEKCEDIFLTFFRVGQRRGSKVNEVNEVTVHTEGNVQKTEKSKDMGGKSQANQLVQEDVSYPKLPDIGIDEVGKFLDTIRIYGIICETYGNLTQQDCYAETNIGKLREGDLISGGLERIISISKEGILTNLRMIVF